MSRRMRRRPKIRRRTIAEYESEIKETARHDGLTSRDVTGFVAACEEALRSDVPFAKVGAVIMCQGVIVGTGHNSLRTDPVQRRWNRYRTFAYLTPSDPSNMDSIHAEIAAIKSLSYEVNRQLKWGQARVYVFRVAPGLPLGHGMARPCPACWKALEDKGVRQVAYTTDKGFAKEFVGS